MMPDRLDLSEPTNQGSSTPSRASLYRWKMASSAL